MDKLVLPDLVMAFLGVFLNQEQERILDTINVFKCTRPRMLLMWKLSNPTLLNWSRSSALTQRFGGSLLSSMSTFQACCRDLKIKTF